MAAKKEIKQKKDLKLVEKTAKELLVKMGVEAGLSVEESEESVVVNIDTDKHKGLLIGARGETLTSFQTVLNLILRNEVGDWQNVVVNIGDWREKQEDYLVSLAKQAATRATETGRPQNLYNLNPSQRRVVHTHLSEDESVESFSEGEGRDRYLVVRSKNADGAESEKN